MAERAKFKIGMQDPGRYGFKRTPLATGEPAVGTTATAQTGGGGIPFISYKGRPVGEAIAAGLRDIGAAGTFTADFVPPGEAPGPGISPQPAEAPQGVSNLTRDVPRATTSAPVDTSVEDFLRQNAGTTPGGGFSVSGPRIIRRPGEVPLLTNLTGERLEAAQQQPEQVGDVVALGGRFNQITSPEQASRLGFRSATVAPAGAEAPTFTPAPDSTGLNRLGARLAEASFGREDQPRTFEEVLNSLQAPSTVPGGALAVNLARGIYQSEVAAANRGENLATREQNLGFKARERATAEQNAATQSRLATVQEANALTAAKRLSTDLGGDLEPVYEERPVDPENPLLGTTKTLTGFTRKGKGVDVPAYIPLAEVNAYQQALSLATTQEQKDALKRDFTSIYPNR